MLIEQIQVDSIDYSDNSTSTYYLIQRDGVPVYGTNTTDLTTSNNMYDDIVAAFGSFTPVTETVLQSDTVTPP